MAMTPHSTIKRLDREFEEKFVYVGRNQADQLQRQLKPYTTPDDILSHLHTRDKEIIKAVVEMVEKMATMTETIKLEDKVVEITYVRKDDLLTLLNRFLEANP